VVEKFTEKINWMTTNRCNLSCHSCIKFNDENPDSKKDLEKIASRLVELNVKKVKITGGEPSLLDLESSLKILKQNNVYLDYHTNGLSFEEKFDTLVKYVDEISLPYDTFNKNTQIQMRGKGFEKTHDSFFEYAKKIKEKNKKLTIHTLFSEINKDDIFETYKKLKKINFDRWKIYENEAYIVETRDYDKNNDVDDKDYKNVIDWENDEFGGVDCLFANMLVLEEKIKNNKLEFIGKLDSREYFFVNNLGNIKYYHDCMPKEKLIGNIFDINSFNELDRNKVINLDNFLFKKEYQPFFMTLVDGNYFFEECEKYKNKRTICKFARLYENHLEKRGELWN
jgi:MoaA/NifB/PqqE/SkfB family radical SAM enzyme